MRQPARLHPSVQGAPCTSQRNRGGRRLPHRGAPSEPERYQHRPPCSTHRNRDDDDYHAEVTHWSPSGTNIARHVKHIEINAGNDLHAEVADRSPSVSCIRRHVKKMGNDGDDDSHTRVTHRAPNVTSIRHPVEHTGNESATTFTQRLRTSSRAFPF